MLALTGEHGTLLKNEFVATVLTKTVPVQESDEEQQSRQV